jgi:hypothetical protein
LMEPLRLIRGTRDARSYEEVVRELAQLVALLELHPEIEQTANVGGIQVCRGPMEGYSVMLHAADVYVMHLGDMTNADGEGERRWRKAQDYWAARQKKQKKQEA